MRPHRASTILPLGILGIFCFICGIIAWVMANNDLEMMDAGHMDPSGRDQTLTGKTCGIVGTILGVVAVILFILYTIFIVKVAGGIDRPEPPKMIFK